MNSQAEPFIHFQFCVDALNEAWSILKVVQAEPENHLRVPALRYALIAYAKPYRRSIGVDHGRLVLDDLCVPAEFQDLHEKLLSDRDQIHAHSDLRAYQPKTYTDEADPDRYAGYICNYINPASGLANLESIINLIEGTLERMYAKEKVLRERLTL